MNLSTILADPRRRNLAVLAAAALVTLLLALGALWQQSSLGESSTAPSGTLSRPAQALRW